MAGVLASPAVGRRIELGARRKGRETVERGESRAK